MVEAAVELHDEPGRPSEAVRQEHEREDVPLVTGAAHRGTPDLQQEGRGRSIGRWQPQRAAFDVNAAIAPALEKFCAVRVGCFRWLPAGLCAEALEVDVRRDQRDASGFELSAAHRAPGIESDRQLRRAQQDVGMSRLSQFHAAKNSFRAVPAPTQSKLAEAHVQSGLRLHQPLERGAMLGNPRERQLIGKDDDQKECGRGPEADQPDAFPASVTK